MYHGAAHVERYHAVGHVQKQGVQLGPLVFDLVQRGMQNARHFVKRAREDSDFVRRFHGQFLAEFPGGDFLRARRELFQRSHHGFGQKKAQHGGNEQA